MKAVLVALLAFALLVGLAQSLRCYTCTSAATSAACNTETDCPAERNSFCQKVEASVSSVGSVVAKSCEATCTEGSVNAGGASNSVSCCSTDLCNGATTARISYGMLALALGVSAFLLRAGF